MNRWPDFFIVGAARSGTTSLYYYLAGNPDIFMPSKVKEPRFFCKLDTRINAAREMALGVGIVTDEKQYLKLFDSAKQQQICGEASTMYLADELVPARIWEKNPQAKIIAILRQPVERAYSTYLLAVRDGREKISTFYDALQKDHEYMVNFTVEGSPYIWPGCYYRHVRRYQEQFGTEQVRVYLYDDLAADTVAIVRDICTFLEVPFYNGRFFDPSQQYHVYGAPSNTLFKWLYGTRTVRSLASAVVPMQPLIRFRDRLLNREQPKPPLEPKAREFLWSIYQDDILKLQDLIERDLSDWLA